MLLSFEMKDRLPVLFPGVAVFWFCGPRSSFWPMAKCLYIDNRSLIHDA
jgi:hypothetical protein